MKSSRTPDINLILTLIGRGIFRLIGWRTEGQIPDVPKFVIVGAPHTSNLDGLLMFPAAWLFRVRLRWMGKQSLFRPPLGWLLRWLGGVPIDRSGPRRAVQQMVDTFSQHDRLALLVTPEGTRGKAERWKTGFYYIAQGAGVPIVLAYIDYRRRVIGIGPIIQPDGDLDADLRLMHTFYSDKAARYPDKVTLPLGGSPS